MASGETFCPFLLQASLRWNTKARGRSISATRKLMDRTNFSFQDLQTDYIAEEVVWGCLDRGDQWNTSVSKSAYVGSFIQLFLKVVKSKWEKFSSSLRGKTFLYFPKIAISQFIALQSKLVLDATKTFSH